MYSLLPYIWRISLNKKEEGKVESQCIIWADEVGGWVDRAWPWKFEQLCRTGKVGQPNLKKNSGGSLSFRPSSPFPAATLDFPSN